jgi:hypothetical protein
VWRFGKKTCILVEEPHLLQSSLKYRGRFFGKRSLRMTGFKKEGQDDSLRKFEPSTRLPSVPSCPLVSFLFIQVANLHRAVRYRTPATLRERTSDQHAIPQSVFSAA